MGELKDTGGEYYTEITPAWEAGEFDPTMQEWLQLPRAREDHGCPHCTYPFWGTLNPRGYFLVRQCRGCKGTFRESVPNPYTLADIVDAYMGKPRLFGTGKRVER